MGSQGLTQEDFKMFKSFILLALSAFNVRNLREEFTCQECVYELRVFSRTVFESNDDIAAYVRDHWCPAVLTNDPSCHNHIETEYPKMLDDVILHFFLDGALSWCQAEGICGVGATVDLLDISHKRPREYTCQECIQGMEYIERLMKDPLFVDEMVYRLKTNYCFINAADYNQCISDATAYFPSMHRMAANHYLNPVDMCNDYLLDHVCAPPTEAPTTVPSSNV